ncbi:MAG: tetratricopeptide repeat protein [Myxacorys chilensis ATA2-1-KO14]|nr:tetratricopeptide repeat protein [Myxacorys chilensis ATA2-1-KO14]
MGKTQLAVQYATRHKQDYGGGIYWLNGRTGDLATQILLKAEFDQQLEGLAAAKEQYIDLEQLVQWCWRHWTPNETTLVVLDDIPEWAKCRSYCPKEARFRVLVTTRRKDVLPNFPRIDLEMLQPPEARSLLAGLEKHGRVNKDSELADKLCEGLGYLPLGIELVGCYLARDRHTTLSQVWERLQANGMQDPALERSQEDEITAERGVRAAFVLTWETLDADEQQVARLLSYFARDWISWNLAEWMMQRVEGEAYLLGERKARLENASIVQIEKDAPGVCRLHPLIRQFLQEQEAEAVKTVDEAPLRSAFVLVMSAIAGRMPHNPPTKDIEWFSGVRSHVQEVADHYTEGLEGGDLLWSFIGLAQFYAGQALFTEAEHWCAKCLEVTQRLFEGNHPDVALSLNSLAGLYYSQGRYSEAEPLYEQALAMYQVLFEGDHPDVALSLNNLALLYYSQGRYSEAEPLYEQALAMRQGLFESDHPDVATNLNNLALLYESQGRYSEAEPLYEQALAMRQGLFESDHPDVAGSLNNLAYLYESQGRYSEAEPLYEQALTMYQVLFEGDHPNVALSLNNLASLYRSQGRYSKAETLYEQALTMYQVLFEGDHPDVALSLNNLAGLYNWQGRYSEAEPLYEQALAMFERMLGTNHPHTKTVRENLAEFRQKTQMSDRHLRSTDHQLRSSDRRPLRRSFLHQLLRQIKRFIGQVMRFVFH